MKTPAALFLDIDGTILRSDHTLSPRVARAVAALGEAGVLVCLATGRSWEALEPLYRRLGLSGPTICYNGALIAAGRDGQILSEARMDNRAASFAIEQARALSMECVAYRHARLLYEERGPYVEQYRKRVALDGSQVNFDTLDGPDFTKMIVMSEHSKLEGLQKILSGRFRADRLTTLFSDPSFLELVAGGVDKGRGLREVCRLRGLRPEDTVAMGDGWNDLALLEAAGDAWVMGGAPEELKCRFPADRQAPDSDADGAALVMENLLKGAAAPDG